MGVKTSIIDHLVEEWRRILWVKYSSRMERMESAAFPDWEEERFHLERSGAVRGENDGDFVPDKWAQPSLFESLAQLQVFNISPAGRE
jgi:hypothetical protein